MWILSKEVPQGFYRFEDCKTHPENPEWPPECLRGPQEFPKSASERGPAKRASSIWQMCFSAAVVNLFDGNHDYILFYGAIWPQKAETLCLQYSVLWGPLGTKDDVPEDQTTESFTCWNKKGEKKIRPRKHQKGGLRPSILDTPWAEGPANS